MGNKTYHVCIISQDIFSFFSNDPIDKIGGAERQQYFILNGLKERGNDISIITGEYGDQIKEVHESVEIFKIIPRGTGLSGFHRKIIHLYRGIVNTDADIYYVRASPILCILTSSICNILNKKFVYCVANDNAIEPERLRDSEESVLGHLPLQFLLRKLYIKSISKANHVVVLTEHQKNTLEKYYDIPSTVIPVGYNLPDNDIILEPTERKGYLWVGRISRNKEPKMLINLARTLPDVQFTMIGPGNDNNYSKTIINKARNTDNISYLGYMPPDNIFKYYNSCKGFIQTTNTTAGFGNTTLEAWSYATPVISLYSNFDGKINDQELGLYCDGDFNKLRDNISLVEDNPDLISKYGWNGRKYIKDNFILSNVIDEYDDLFSNLAQEG